MEGEPRQWSCGKLLDPDVLGAVHSSSERQLAVVGREPPTPVHVPLVEGPSRVDRHRGSAALHPHELGPGVHRVEAGQVDQRAVVGHAHERIRNAARQRDFVHHGHGGARELAGPGIEARGHDLAFFRREDEVARPDQVRFGPEGHHFRFSGGRIQDLDSARATTPGEEQSVGARDRFDLTQPVRLGAP